jgi:hypothetical protein
MARSLGVSLLRGRCNMNVGVWGHSEALSRSGTAIESDGALNSSDDGFDFPPTLHPVRELVTFSIFMAVVIAVLVWGGSKLVQVIF